ncbi:MAG: outer membrane beta-barrel protein [Oligoflexia bacterium]|nr:outer membrane beta-barrel protein [Oligoflexia bacterium]
MKQLSNYGLTMLGLIVSFGIGAHAQSYNVVTTQTAQPPQQVEQPVQAQATVQPIYIVNPGPNQAAAQVQPTTQVEAQSVRESRLDAIRKQREEIERQTEEKLQQRIEDDRVQAEKERQERLLAPLGIQVAPSNAVSGSAPQTVIVQEKPAVVTTVVTTAPSATSEQNSEGGGKFRMGGALGIGSYPTVSNVTPVYSVGFTADYYFPERFAVEGAFSYSSFDITTAVPCYYCPNPNLVTTMTQMNFTGGVTYLILKNKLTPVVGGHVGYTRRSYTGRISYGSPTPYGSSGETTSGSNAFDAGLSAGAALVLSERFTIGATIKWFFNLSYRTDDPLTYAYGPPVGSAIESLNYYLATVDFKIAL